MVSLNPDQPQTHCESEDIPKLVAAGLCYLMDSSFYHLSSLWFHHLILDIRETRVEGKQIPKSNFPFCCLYDHNY